MNFYGTDKYKQLIESLNKQVYSKCDLSKPTREKILDEVYSIKYYYYADIENKEEGYAAIDGEICQLYKNEKQIYEWKNIDGMSRVAVIIKHSDGNRYLLFDEDLYGYSVLNLETLECIHYIPNESHLEDGFEETFIWCDPHYRSDNNLLAVEGCYWGAPTSIIILNFDNPMKIVPANNWTEIYEKYKNDYDLEGHIDFVDWKDDKLICKVTGKKEHIVSIDIHELSTRMR